jgi:hypothetical protein
MTHIASESHTQSNQTRAVEGLAEVSWGDKLKNTTSSSSHEDHLAAQFGYAPAGWDRARPSNMSSISAWGAVSDDQPAPPPPAPNQNAVSEAEQWGYTAKPYVPPAIPITMPLLANPAAMHIPPPPLPGQMNGAHLVIENIPMELNMMSLLYEHFRQFGEVAAVHCIQKHNKALVDFKTREIAETAASQPILGVPTIRASVFNGPSRGLGSTGRSAMPGRGGQAPVATPIITTGRNLVLESDAARRAREKREKQIEIDKKRQELLQTCSDHVKMIVAKLSDKSLTEEVRDKYTKMLETVKAKISALQLEDAERKRKESEAAHKAFAMRYKAYEKQVRAESSKRQQELTLDLRSRCVKISQLPEELAQSIVLVEYLRAMDMKDLDDVIWLEGRIAAILRFKTHDAANQLIRHELAFKAEWVTNDAAQDFANFNPVERVDLNDVGDDDLLPYSG